MYCCLFRTPHDSVIRKKRRGKMKSFRIVVSLLIFLLFVACTSSTVLVLPKNKDGSYCIAKVPYGDWVGSESITLLDNSNNSITCKAKHRMIKNALSCEGKKYNTQLTCFNNKKVDFSFEMISCTEAYGVAILDSGEEYEVYIGLSDDSIKDKLAKYKDDNRT